MTVSPDDLTLIREALDEAIAVGCQGRCDRSNCGWHDALAALARVEQRLAALEEALRISYPMTPVDCLISDLRAEFELTTALNYETFCERVAEFKAEVASESAANRQPGDERPGAQGGTASQVPHPTAALSVEQRQP